MSRSSPIIDENSWILPEGIKKIPQLGITYSKTIINLWINYFEQYPDASPELEQKADQLALQGFPREIRKLAYLKISKAEDTIINTIPLSSSLSTDQINAFKKQIHNDVERTYKNCLWMHDPNNRLRIENLLVRYIMVDEGLEYTQGMNFFAAIFTQVLDDCEAFWTMYNLFNDYKHNQSFVMHADMTGLLHHLDVHKRFLKKRLPKISNVLEQFKVEPILYAPVWFLSGGLGNQMPSSMIYLIMDRYVYFGQRSTHSLLLAMMKTQEALILNASSSQEIFQAINSIGLLFFKINLKNFIECWNELMISQDEYEDEVGDDF
ncbi:TBC domain containing protein [Histomonas meleagridis]|uniref:TBC domain containing protein n=1 Tax=Histomonas meleagridis TaxID=135588 RepID=UPI00355A3C64|nr:TBC domain containing protein [Histomonas meleagridis]KAH0798084.1 TBC domain containing protein [Histomonas meleagridis]